MKAVILAGGRGKRLRKITEKTQKTMLKVGRLPVLHHQINLLKKYGIKDIIFLTSWRVDEIKNYFKDGTHFGVKIRYFNEEAPISTTGERVKEIESHLKNDFLVLYGDVMVNMDIKAFINFHKRKKGDGALVVHPNDHPYDSDLLEIDNEQKIIAFHPKPHPENKYFRNLDNACLYVLSPKILKYIKRGERADFGRDVFPKLVKKVNFYGYNTAEYLKDIGTPERLAEVGKDYLSGKISRFHRKNKRKAIFMDRDGVLNEKAGHLYKIKDFKFLPGAAKAIKKINESEFLAIVITNQPVVARGLLSIQQLEEIHKKMETLLGREKAKLDAIYYCPHYPDKGFPGENKKYKIKCNCRKPKIGMVKKAKKDFNIDLKRSYFIGDSFRDILCGKNAGIITVGVKTGEGCRDYDVKPDYFFDNIYKAVNYIIKKK